MVKLLPRRMSKCLLLMIPKSHKYIAQKGGSYEPPFCTGADSIPAP